MFSGWQEVRRFPNAPVGYIYAGDAGCPDGGSESHWLQFAPRFGFSYDLTGKGRTVIRGGYGLFYQPPFVESFNNMVDSAPFSPQYYRYGVDFMDPFKGTRNPFPEEYGPRVPPSNVAFQLPMAAVSYSGDWRPAQIQSWNIAVEHQLHSDLLIRGAYVGSKGTHLGYNTNLNAARYVPGASGDDIDARRPYQDFQSVIQDEAAANSLYNSFQVTAEKRFSRGFSVLANYTWAKAVDPVSYQTDLCSVNIINPFNVRAYRGLSDYDIPHRFVLSYLWQLPSLRSSSALIRGLLGGWETSGIWNWQSGFPLTVDSGDDRALSGIGNDTADVIGDPYLSPDRARKDLVAKYFNTSAFQQAQLGTFGNAGRNILRGPGTFQVDFSAMKNFVIRERLRFQYRAEFFNLFNTPLFNNPVASVPDDRFGRSPVPAIRASFRWLSSCIFDPLCDVWRVHIKDMQCRTGAQGAFFCSGSRERWVLVVVHEAAIFGQGPEHREHPVTQSAAGLTIDGNLEEPFWKPVPALTLTPGTAGVPSDLGGDVRIALRGADLVFAARCIEPGGKVLARSVGRNPVWERDMLGSPEVEDRVEFRLKYTSGGVQHRVDLAINPWGAFRLERDGQPAPGVSIQTAAKVGSGAWSVEAVLPLQLLEIDQAPPRPL